MSEVSVGIDDIAVYLPKLCFEMKDFAQFRGVDYGKLSRGLGLESMAVPDVHEDPATMGANAVMRLIDRNELNPRQIGRLYLGTESALDGAKPTATYILDMLSQRYGPIYGQDCFAHCDVVDMTFACVGAVDALHNTLDWVVRGKTESQRLGLVVFTDNAKYDLGSSGEYTQGAGAGALLIKHDPRLLSIPNIWGVSTEPAHDFFKPRRHISPSALIDQVLQAAQKAGVQLTDDAVVDTLSILQESSEHSDLWCNAQIAMHRDTPLFDGPLSNRCYAQRVKEAFIHFRNQAIHSGRISADDKQLLTEQWKRVILHLPYAFQGQRMFPDVFKYERRGRAEWNEIKEQIGEEPQRSLFTTDSDYERARDGYRRALSKTESYRDFVKDKIERGQRASSLVGNLYTGSIFMSLLSTLEADLESGEELGGALIGLCGYGSGAKAKVFEAQVQPAWKEVTVQFQLMDRLRQRRTINAKEYEDLHRGQQQKSLYTPSNEFVLCQVGGEGLMEGQRKYAYVGNN